MEPTQISLGGFGEGVTAKELASFLKENVGGEENVGVVWKCRLKTSWTPLFSYPKFGDRTNYMVYNKANVPPHAFVHFAAPAAVKDVTRLVKEGKLVFNGNGNALKVRVGSETNSRVLRRRAIPPLRFSPVSVEIGSLYSHDEFLVVWRRTRVDFHVDPFDKRCRIFFTRDQLFAIQDTGKDTLIKCDFKIEFLVRDIRNARFLKDRGTFIMLLELRLAPCICYRTGDADVYEGCEYPLLDDDDPWIRTLDFSHNNAVGRCLVYKIVLSSGFGHTMKKAKDYLRQRLLLDEKVSCLKSWVEPDVPTKGFFVVLPPCRILDFHTAFLLNALVHKGILNYHRLIPEFYDLLRPNVTSTKLSTMALRHMFSYTYPVFDALGRPKLVLSWISKYSKLLKTPRIVEETIEIRRMVITPTKAYCLPPEVELSNRVIRNFKEYADRFLRVTFMDDNMEPMSSMVLSVPIATIVKDVSTNSIFKTAIFSRVKNILTGLSSEGEIIPF